MKLDLIQSILKKTNTKEGLSDQDFLYGCAHSFIFPGVLGMSTNAPGGNVSLNSNFVKLDLIQIMLYNNPKPQDTKEGLSDQDFSIYMDFEFITKAHSAFSGNCVQKKFPSYMPAGVLGICKKMPRSRLASGNMLFAQTTFLFSCRDSGFIYKRFQPNWPDFHHRLLYFFKCPFL